MDAWKLFWTAALLVAGSGFALITLVVAVKGVQDLRAMLRGLQKNADDAKRR
jgi:hypothetical protein